MQHVLQLGPQLTDKLGTLICFPSNESFVDCYSLAKKGTSQMTLAISAGHKINEVITRKIIVVGHGHSSGLRDAFALERLKWRKASTVATAPSPPP